MSSVQHIQKNAENGYQAKLLGLFSTCAMVLAVVAYQEINADMIQHASLYGSGQITLTRQPIQRKRKIQRYHFAKDGDELYGMTLSLCTDAIKAHHLPSSTS